MTKIILGPEIFEPISAAAQYESDYERLILSQASSLFPGFLTVPFKVSVHSQYGTAQSDLALIDKDYRTWWVVEVELASHSLDRHVEPQVRILSTGEYGEPHAVALQAASDQIRPGRVKDLVRWVPPRVLVVVNSPSPSWTEVLRQYHAQVAVVEVFRSARHREVLRLNGEPPESLGRVLTDGEIDPLLPSSLKVRAPAALPVGNGERMKLWFDDGITEWQRVDVENQVWLMPSGRCPLPPRMRRFSIDRDQEGAYFLHVFA